MADSCVRDAIYFDGALPASKEKIRVQRLERTRKQLEEYRKLHHEAPPPAASPNLAIDYKRAIWLQAAMSGRRVLPPPPPFMVPAVIEALLKSPLGERVHVVPEEADVACARMARTSGSAILSNDSDMSIYDLGPGNCVALLHTLEEISYRLPVAKSGLTISCICPSDISKRLKINSLLRLAFERSLDGTVTTATVAERARKQPTDANQGAFESFAAEYLVADQQWTGDSLRPLDPRTAEFVVGTFSSGATTSPHVYLPIIHEDPTRDSSWSYGLELRQIAFSLYSVVSEPATPSKSVVEYARKGGRIAATDIPVLRGYNLHPAASAVLADLQLRSPATSLQWWLYALHRVVRQKLDAGKIVTHANIDAVLGLKGTRSKCTWSDVHLHANIQAVLYSARMLAQLLQYVGRSKRGADSRVIPAEELTAVLSKLPSSAELFLSIEELRALCWSQLDPSKYMLEGVFALIREHDVKSTHERGDLTTAAAEDPLGSDGVFETPRKRIKTASSARHTSLQQKKNMFHLLAGDDSTEDGED